MIVNMPCREPVRFHLSDKVLDVDIEKWPLEDQPLWSTQHYASMLVYAGTCWRFWKLKIPLTRKSRKRIVLASLIEASRFASHFPDESFDWTGYFKERMIHFRATGDVFDRSVPTRFLQGPV